MTEEELKKEAEEYAEGMAKYYASTHEDCIPSQFEKYLRNAYISSAKPREKRIAELEKKNAELKAFRQDCVKLTEDNVVIVRQRAETSKQLTKATELLRKLVLEVTGYEEIYGYDTCEPVQEAEQFLKEVEK